MNFKTKKEAEEIFHRIQLLPKARRKVLGRILESVNQDWVDASIIIEGIYSWINTSENRLRKDYSLMIPVRW